MGRKSRTKIGLAPVLLSSPGADIDAADRGGRRERGVGCLSEREEDVSLHGERRLPACDEGSGRLGEFIVIQAKRIKGHAELDRTAICYWKAKECWLIYLPHCGIGSLAQHTIEEHHSGSITVSPSILMKGYDDESATAAPTERHGHLIWGYWQECDSQELST